VPIVAISSVKLKTENVLPLSFDDKNSSANKYLKGILKVKKSKCKSSNNTNNPKIIDGIASIQPINLKR
jgi:hypothetical protein